MQGFTRTLAGPLTEGRVNKREAATLNFAKQVAVCTWDFSVDGGATGDYSFNTQLPANAVVTDAWTDEITAVTGAGAVNVKLICGSTDITTAEDITADAGIQKRPLTSTEGLKFSSGGELKMNIATSAATAGKVRWAVEYFVSTGP